MAGFVTPGPTRYHVQSVFQGSKVQFYMTNVLIIKDDKRLRALFVYTSVGLGGGLNYHTIFLTYDAKYAVRVSVPVST